MKNYWQHYIKGYIDCIDDLETMFPKNIDTTNPIQLLNLYIIATYLLKLNLQEMQEELNDKKKQKKDITQRIIIIKGGK